MGYIHQLGGRSNFPTECMSSANGGTWATHFSLKYILTYRCAVKISVNQVFTVSRTQVYVYNVVSGAATKYTSPPITVSFDILMHKLHYGLYASLVILNIPWNMKKTLSKNICLKINLLEFKINLCHFFKAFRDLQGFSCAFVNNNGKYGVIMAGGVYYQTCRALLFFRIPYFLSPTFKTWIPYFWSPTFWRPKKRAPKKRVFFSMRKKHALLQKKPACFCQKKHTLFLCKKKVRASAKKKRTLFLALFLG